MSYDPVADSPGGLERLSKGLHEFHVGPGGTAAKLPESYLHDYLDAFIEEAYEHEYAEAKEGTPRMEGGDPHMHLARAVYNELLVFAVHNSNLLRAIKKFDIKHPLYVLKRLNALNLCRVDTENYEADRMAQVAGYHPEKVEGIALESPKGYHKSLDHAFAAVERAEQEHKIRGGQVVVPRHEMVQLRDDDAIDPFVELKKAHDARPDGLGRIYDHNFDAVKANRDGDCVIHGHRDLTKSMNLNNAFAHCTCPPNDE